MKEFDKKINKAPKWFVNNNIRAPKVICIDSNNINLGTIPTYQALKLAQETGLDLVQIAFKEGATPTCKIIDFGKYKYEASKKQKSIEKKQRESIVKLKEIKFRPTTSINDLKTKARQVEEFLNDGYKVKVVVSFKGREASHQEVGNATLETFLGLISNYQFAEQGALEQKDITVFLIKKAV